MNNVYVLVRIKEGKSRTITDLFKTLKGATAKMEKLEGQWTDEFYHIEKWPLHD